jgi:hypothetical protein
MIDRQYSSYCFLASELLCMRNINCNPIDWLYAACLEYLIFFSIDSSEARKQYDEYCLSIMQTITYAHDRTHFQGTGWIVPLDLREWNWFKLGLQLIFRMHNSDPTPQGVENINILLWLKCVLTALHVNCMILFDKVL